MFRVVLLAALAFQASADIAGRGLRTYSFGAAAAPASVPGAAGAAQVPAPAPMAAPAPAPAPYNGPPTKMPWQKIAVPVVGGIVGAGALAGAIAMTVLKHSTTTNPFLAQRPQIAAKEAAAKEAAAAAAPTEAPVIQAAGTDGDVLSSGMPKTTVMYIGGALLALLVLAVCIGIFMRFAGGGTKKRSKKAAPTAYPFEKPEDQQPILAQQQSPPESSKTPSYTPMVAPLTPSSGYSGNMPTMTNVVPMQTIPPPAPPPQYSAQQQRYSAPTTGSVPMPMIQQASPLAQTVTALPTTTFSGMQGQGPLGSMQAPPTQYF